MSEDANPPDPRWASIGGTTTHGDWPQELPPPFAADDENDEAPDE